MRKTSRDQPAGLHLSIRVWDLPIRLFHWLLVALLLACYFSQHYNKMALHMLCGEAVAALLLWRLLWGVVGSDTARFRHFLAGPLAAVQHLLHFTRREPDTQIGHNAAGGWMVLAMLAVLLAQVGTGLFGRNDDDVIEGPLSKFIDPDRSAAVMNLHFRNFALIEILVAAHIVALIAYALVKRHNLVRPMVSGKKRLPAATPAPRMVSTALAVALLVLSGAVVWVAVTR